MLLHEFNMTRKRKAQLTVLAVILLLILTNPGVKRFKEFMGQDSYAGLERTRNWLIFSIYEKRGGKYVGIFLNFITIERYDNHYYR